MGDSTAKGLALKGASAYLQCKVISRMDASGHTIVCAEAIDGQLFAMRPQPPTTARLPHITDCGVMKLFADASSASLCDVARQSVAQQSSSAWSCPTAVPLESASLCDVARQSVAQQSSSAPSCPTAVPLEAHAFLHPLARHFASDVPAP